MKKFGLYSPNGHRYAVLKKGLIIMKITLLLILVSTFNLLAIDTYSQTARVSLNLNQISLKQALKEIERSSEFYFLYDNELVDVERKVDIKADNEQINTILDRLFANQDTKYAVYDRQIVISPANMPLPQEVQRKISGKVTDQAGIPIPGASVVVKGTTRGITTDIDGNFALTLPADAKELIFSFIGMQSQVIGIAGKTLFNIVMKEDAIGIEEVVAIGYGTQKNSLVTGAISKIKSESLSELTVGRIDQALMGKLAGIQTQQLSGAPGRAVNIKVRGTSSISYSGSPLYVVDGYPIDGDLSTVNTNDVESIEVLKDAASAAIYGSRGSNGVILITTKTGKKGKPVLSANVYYGLQSRFSRYDVLNRDEWIDFAIEERNNSWVLAGGNKNDPNSKRSNSAYWIDPLWLTNPTSFPDNDWQDIVDRVSPVQNYQISASGANDLVKYYISGTYFDQEGIIVNSYYKRLSFQSNIETKFSDIVSMGLNLSGAITDQNDPDTDSYGAGISRSWMMPPVIDIDQNTENTGYYPYSGSFIVNPYHWMKETLNQSKGNYLLSNIYFDVALASNLKWRSSFGMERRGYNTQYFKKNYVNRGSGTIGSAGSILKQNYLTENTLNYHLGKKDWTVDAMGGFTYQANTYNDMILNKTGFPDESIQTLNVASTLSSGSSTASQWRLMSFIGRINMSIKDKYLLTSNIRRDGSSRFGSDNRWGWFPSLSLGWRIAEEDFMKKFDWLSNMKLRGSYGVVGNNNIGDYSSIGALTVKNAITGTPENIVSGLAPSSFSNTSLGWEKTMTTDVGIDLGFLKNRVQITADYYIANTRDLLLDLQIPQVTGFNSSLQNIGEVQNKGLEFELSTANLTNAFKWNTSFNISFNRNKVIKLGLDRAPVYGYSSGVNVTITEIGKPIGSFYLFEQEGVFMDQADFDSHPHYKTQNVGDIKYKDFNKDGVIDSKDIHIVGDAFPDFYWGMRNTFSYKGLDLSIDIDGQQGSDILNMAILRSAGQSRNNEWGVWRNRWRSPENPGDGMTPRAAVTANLTTPSTFSLFDGSFWSIRNVVLGYNIPVAVARKIPGVNSLRVYASVENLFMHDHYNHTPQTANYSNTALVPNTDYAAAYPIATTYTFGINIKF